MYKLILIQYNSSLAKTNMEFNVHKTKISSFTCKTNSIHFNYYLNDVSVLCTDYVKELGVLFGSKLHFHCHVNYVHS
jgi:hypothetical protein